MGLCGAAVLSRRTGEYIRKGRTGKEGVHMMIMSFTGKVREFRTWLAEWRGTGRQARPALFRRWLH